MTHTKLPCAHSKSFRGYSRIQNFEADFPLKVSIKNAEFDDL